MEKRGQCPSTPLKPWTMLWTVSKMFLWVPIWHQTMCMQWASKLCVNYWAGILWELSHLSQSTVPVCVCLYFCDGSTGHKCLAASLSLLYSILIFLAFVFFLIQFSLTCFSVSLLSISPPSFPVLPALYIMGQPRTITHPYIVNDMDLQREGVFFELYNMDIVISPTGF